MALVVLLGGCTGASGQEESAPRIVQPGAPGEDSQVLDPEEVPEAQLPEHTEADVAFMHAMVAHHSQALRMTALVPDRTGRDDVPLFAERIELSQQDEIDLIHRWLDARDEPLPDQDVQHGHVGPDGKAMPGMLTEEQFAQLEAANGKEFDRLFLELMHHHHRGAVQMVQDLLASGNGEELELWRLVNHIDSDQTIELGRIEMMLAEMVTAAD